MSYSRLICDIRNYISSPAHPFKDPIFVSRNITLKNLGGGFWPPDFSKASWRVRCLGDIFVSSEGGDQSLDCCKLDFVLQATHSPFPDYYSSHVHLGGLMAAAITRFFLSYSIWSDFVLICIHPRFHEFVIYATSLLDSSWTILILCIAGKLVRHSPRIRGDGATSAGYVLVFGGAFCVRVRGREGTDIGGDGLPHFVISWKERKLREGGWLRRHGTRIYYELKINTFFFT